MQEFNSGGAIYPELLNLSSLKNMESGLQEILSKHGEIGSLVNNAALAQHKDFIEISELDLDLILQVNFKAPFYLTQKLLKGMLDHKWGRIVNVVSVGGQWGGTKQVHYATSKSALIGLTKSIAKSYSAHGITCNAISPGYIDTQMLRAEISGDGLKNLAATIPAGKIGTPEDVAQSVKFLISEGASYITGQTINVNGGILFS
jgi:acetoacetyl-CoA reductase/3-oxoacyl-[acyl-carrier protein] reductase